MTTSVLKILFYFPDRSSGINALACIALLVLLTPVNAQVLLGENKPLWMALIPAAAEACFGVFVQFEELWTHSKAKPDKGVVRQVRISVVCMPYA